MDPKVSVSSLMTVLGRSLDQVKNKGPVCQLGNSRWKSLGVEKGKPCRVDVQISSFGTWFSSSGAQWCAVQCETELAIQNFWTATSAPLRKGRQLKIAWIYVTKWSGFFCSSTGPFWTPEMSITKSAGNCLQMRNFRWTVF